MIQINNTVNILDYTNITQRTVLNSFFAQFNHNLKNYLFIYGSTLKNTEKSITKQ